MLAQEGSSVSDFPFELQSLAIAVRYQRWLIEEVAPFLGKRILELGSGIGNMSQHLPRGELTVLSDVEARFVNELSRRFSDELAPAGTVQVQLTDVNRSFYDQMSGHDLDTIISFNVMEHVEDDIALTRDCLRLLRDSKAEGTKMLVTLVPAHQWAYGTIDKSFGHFRRYNEKSYRKVLAEAGFEGFRRPFYHSRYINTVGLMGWYVHNRILKTPSIELKSLKTFEKLQPYIRAVDKVFRKIRLPMGQSLLVFAEVNEQSFPGK